MPCEPEEFRRELRAAGGRSPIERSRRYHRRACQGRHWPFFQCRPCLSKRAGDKAGAAPNSDHVDVDRAALSLEVVARRQACPLLFDQFDEGQHPAWSLPFALASLTWDRRQRPLALPPAARRDADDIAAPEVHVIRTAGFFDRRKSSARRSNRPAAPWKTPLAGTGGGRGMAPPPAPHV
jgi:hypothetical protein